MVSISYAITVCNELEEIIKLLNFLQLNIRENDEIVIQYDSSSATQEVKEYLNVMNLLHNEYKVISFPLDNDFASFKNNLKSHCSKDYIFQIDADEIPHEALVEYLPQVLESNPVDVVFVPRINTVEGLTPSHIQKWGWKVDSNGWVNFPDYQLRIYKRTDDVVWMNKVHETITGYNTFSNFPAEEHWCLYHPKEIQRQEKQNDYYSTLQR
jgi:glycosyltransferase involved in cell wall biosynthesis